MGKDPPTEEKNNSTQGEDMLQRKAHIRAKKKCPTSQKPNN